MAHQVYPFFRIRMEGKSWSILLWQPPWLVDMPLRDGKMEECLSNQRQLFDHCCLGCFEIVDRTCASSNEPTSRHRSICHGCRQRMSFVSSSYYYFRCLKKKEVSEWSDWISFSELARSTRPDSRCSRKTLIALLTKIDRIYTC